MEPDFNSMKVVPINCTQRFLDLLMIATAYNSFLVNPENIYLLDRTCRALGNNKKTCLPRVAAFVCFLFS